MSRKRGFERCYPGSSRPWRVCRGYDKNGAGCGGAVVGGGGGGCDCGGTGVSERRLRLFIALP